MDDREQARVVGMALVRGLIGVEALKAAASKGNRSVLEALLDSGKLDEIDVKDLRGIQENPPPEMHRSPVCCHEAGKEAAAHAPLPEDGDAPPEPEDGRVVRENHTLPRWRNYRNLHFVAEGGLGRIFAAFDPSLKRTVALKFLLRDDPVLVRRFVLEAQHQAKVDHPNICKVYEVGEWKDQVYISMQYIHGETLEAAASRMSLTEKVETMEIVAEAINAAHRKGLIHRDIKPANIMIEWLPGGKPKPYVLDFGLARGTEASELTLDGMLIGTTNYMSPEQASGQIDKVGRRSDVYGLGATLFRVLTGRMVNQGVSGRPVASPGAGEQAPERIRRWNPGVSRDLETIVMKCLERIPERRYDSALTLAEDLRRYREGEPILAHPATWCYRTGKYIWKHRLLMGMSAVAVAGVMALGGWALTMRLRVHRVSELATSFGSEASTMLMGLRMDYLLPAHDTRPCKAWVRQRMERVRRIIQAEGRHAEGPGAFALGQGYYALRDYAAARRELEEAWRKNHRDSQVAWALGRSLGELYREGMEELQLTSDRKQRETLEKVLERDFREPAVAYLKFAVAASERRAFVEGHLAFYEGRYSDAVEKAREAFLLEPELYEAKILEGRSMVAMGVACMDADPGKSIWLLQEAGVPYRVALGMARSDPALIYAEATRRCELAKGAFLRRDAPPEGHDQLQELLDQVLAVDPDAAHVYIIKARLALACAIFHGERGDPFPVLRQALSWCEQAECQTQNRLFVAVVRGEIYKWMACFEQKQGTDASQSLERAFGSFHEAADLRPENAWIHQRMAEVCSRQADLARARKGEPGRFLDRGLIHMKEAFRLVEGPDHGQCAADLHTCLGDWQRKYGQTPRMAFCGMTPSASWRTAKLVGQGNVFSFGVAQ